MSTFVLVHGAWHGGWCWKQLTPLLRASGHEVFTPTLTGLGERSHLLNPAVGLDTHVLDTLGVLEYEDLQGVVLVGHSYSGVVVTAVAERAATRLAHVVYLDAFAPGDEQSLWSLLDESGRALFEDAARAEGDGWRIPPPLGPAITRRWGVKDEATIQWMSARVAPHPLQAFKEMVRLSSPAARLLPHTYIHCTDKPQGDLAASSAFAAQARGWTVHRLPTGHDPMVTMPGELARLLLALA